MIKITIERKGKPVMVVEFDDVNKAGTWLVEDSYISNSDVTKVTWENLPDTDCGHHWLMNHGGRLEFRCQYCGMEIRFFHGEMTEFAKTKGQL